MAARFLPAVVTIAFVGVPTLAASEVDSSLTNSLISEVETAFAAIPGAVNHTMTVLGHSMDIQQHHGGVLDVGVELVEQRRAEGRPHGSSGVTDPRECAADTLCI